MALRYAKGGLFKRSKERAGLFTIPSNIFKVLVMLSSSVGFSIDGDEKCSKCGSIFAKMMKRSNCHRTSLRLLQSPLPPQTMACTLEVDSLREHLASSAKRAYDLFVEDNADEYV
jgi:hypothetical protein